MSLESIIERILLTPGCKGKGASARSRGFRGTFCRISRGEGSWFLDVLGSGMGDGPAWFDDVEVFVRAR